MTPDGVPPFDVASLLGVHCYYYFCFLLPPQRGSGNGGAPYQAPTWGILGEQHSGGRAWPPWGTWGLSWEMGEWVWVFEYWTVEVGLQTRG